MCRISLAAVLSLILLTASPSCRAAQWRADAVRLDPDYFRRGYAVLSRLGLPAIAPGILTEAAAIKTVAFGLATSASMAWNFLLYRTWVFRAVQP